jgi:hypothetical protein
MAAPPPSDPELLWTWCQQLAEMSTFATAPAAAAAQDQGEVFFVNMKQYRRILIRRQQRLALEQRRAEQPKRQVRIAVRP